MAYRVDLMERVARALRHVLHRRKPNVCWVGYEINEQDQVVTVLRICHGRRDAFTVSDGYGED